MNFADKISKYAIPTHIQIKNLKNNRLIPKDEIPRLLVVHPSLSYFIILFIFYSIIINNWFPQTQEEMIKGLKLEYQQNFQRNNELPKKRNEQEKTKSKMKRDTSKKDSSPLSRERGDSGYGRRWCGGGGGCMWLSSWLQPGGDAAEVEWWLHQQYDSGCGGDSGDGPGGVGGCCNQGGGSGGRGGGGGSGKKLQPTKLRQIF